MIRLHLLAAATALVAGCGTIVCDHNGTDYRCDGDDRPATLEYVTSTVLRPYCATAGCHSAFAFVGNSKLGTHFRFDTYEDTRDSILHPAPDDPTSVPIVDTVGCDPTVSLLFISLTRETGPNGEAPRMPYDQSLSDADIALVQRWISSDISDPNNRGGALDGLGVDTTACPTGAATP